MSTLASLFACALAAQLGNPDVGPIDQSRPPAIAALRPPQAGRSVPAVGLRAVVSGRVPASVKARHLYVLVNPASNPDTVNVWWVQQPVERDGERISAVCQFGEYGQGEKEYFAVVGLATDRDLAVGEQVSGLPEGSYSKPLIVKRHG